MRTDVSEPMLTPSKITAWLDCAHSLTLRNRLDAGGLEVHRTPMGSLAELLVEKGIDHERNCLSDLENNGRSIYFVPGRNPGESFDEWEGRVAGVLNGDHDVIYQMPFLVNGVRGIADFLVRVKDPQPGFARYEPVDAKLTRTAAKPGHVLQLCFYADALEERLGQPPRAMHVWLGSGETETLLVEEFRPYWRRLRHQLVQRLGDVDVLDTRPEPCQHCEICEFAGECEREWRQHDSLVYVANIRRPERLALESAGIENVAALSIGPDAIAGVDAEHLRRLRRQATLQVISRSQPGSPPAFEIVDPGEDPVYGHGFQKLPAPNDGDVIFDFEGHPFWSPQHDLFFLAGLYLRGDDGSWRYEARWAHSLSEQSTMIAGLVDYFAGRRRRFPLMHVYHYNHTERSSLERLVIGTECENTLTSLVESGLFIDLFDVVRNAIRVGAESYSLKSLEQVAGFVRRGGIDKGAGAIVEYEQFMKSGDVALLDEIAAYNEDDVMATKALRDWLIDQRPDELEWRDAVLAEEEPMVDTDELVRALHEYDDQSVESLLGDLLNYWRRERSAALTPKFVGAASDFATLYENRDYLANLSLVSAITESVLADGGVRKSAEFTWPDQVVDQSFEKGRGVLYASDGTERGYGYLRSFDHANRRLTLSWRTEAETSSVVPSVITLNDYVSPREKPGVLIHLAEQLLHPDPLDPPSKVSLELLGRRRPRLVGAPRDAPMCFDDDLTEMLSWVGRLDESYVAIQGPPGTGKTYRGAHIIYELLKQGKRVGITAMSHAAIDNLLSAAHAVMRDGGDATLLRAVRRIVKAPSTCLDGVRYSNDPRDVEDGDFNLVAGTTWMWARAGMRTHPVDVLIIDEAGQLALADAVASSNAARNLILLGDPLQLAQVAQGDHPGGSGASVLEHVLSGHATIPDYQGVFLAETRRMHPDVSRFISDQIYEGRLTSHESCSQQATDWGTGLRWLRVDHVGRSTESEEEAAVVATRISDMIGTIWIDQDGKSAPLRAEDFLVVAPYNDQVRLIRRVLDHDRTLTGVQVGTVDKFQGREAPVVFFTMTTSSADDMPRGPEFLFSRNRLNVAVSRARCLAFLVCTDELLNARARSIEEMRLIATLNAFVEYAEGTAR